MVRRQRPRSDGLDHRLAAQLGPDRIGDETSLVRFIVQATDLRRVGPVIAAMFMATWDLFALSRNGVVPESADEAD